MGDSTSAPKAPSYTKLINAGTANATTATHLAKQNAKTAQQQYDLLKQQYDAEQGKVDQAVDNSLDISNTDKELGQEGQSAYESTLPALNDFTTQAENFGSDANRNLYMGRASSAVAQDTDAQLADAQRDLESYGINPAATRYAALDYGTRTAEAANQAAAANQASLNVTNTGLQLEDEAAGLGTQEAGVATAANNAGVSAGTAAGDLGLADTATEASVLGSPTQYQSAATSDINASTGALGGASSATNASSQDQLASYNADQSSSSGVGALLGTLGGAAIKAAPKLFAAGGGVIPRFQPGGDVPPGMSPSGGNVTDDVTAQLNSGEFVMPKDVTSWLGEKTLQGLVVKARQERQKQTVARPQAGPAIPGRSAPPSIAVPPHAIPPRAPQMHPMGALPPR